MNAKQWLSVSIVLLGSCSGVQEREGGAQRPSPVAGLHELMKPPMAEVHVAERKRGTPDSYGIEKEEIAPRSRNPVRNRVAEEESEKGSRTDFLEMYTALLEDKKRLTRTLDGFRQREGKVLTDLSAERTRRAHAEEELKRCQAEIRLLEQSLEQQRAQADADRARFLRAEKKRLQLELELVSLKTFLRAKGHQLGEALALHEEDR